MNNELAIFRTRFRGIAEAPNSSDNDNAWQRVSLMSAGLHRHGVGDQVPCQPIANTKDLMGRSPRRKGVARHPRPLPPTLLVPSTPDGTKKKFQR